MTRPPLKALSALILLLMVYAAPAQAVNPDDFVKNIAGKAFASLSKGGVSQDQRTERFRQLLHDAFDLPRIARFTLGRYWRMASDDEKTEFVNLFAKFVIQTYYSRFQEIHGKKLNVIKAREISASQTMVLSEIEISGKSSIKINWRVHSKGGVHKIVDVMIEGISMSVTQRDEFAAVIRQKGGRVGGLIKALRRKTGSN